MSEDFKIEKNVPITNYSKKAQLDDLISRMEVGDSVLIKSHSDVDQLRDAAKRQTKKVSVRLAKDDPDYAFRVWRIK